MYYIHIIIMTTTYLAISSLKQSIIPPMQLKIFLSYLPNELLLEYLSLANVKMVINQFQILY